MKKLSILTCIVSFALLLCACDGVGGLVGELNSPASAYEPFARESYYIAYTSNGDGTCFVSGVVVKGTGVEVKVPEKSPDGDTVTAVKVAFSAVSYPVELPHVLTEQQYDAIMAAMEQGGAKQFDIAKVLAYYMPCSEKSSQEKLEQYPLAAHSKIYILTDTVTDTEYQNIAERLEHYLAGQDLANKIVCDAQVLELCKQYLTEQQTMRMLQAMYPEKPASMKLPSSVPSDAVQLENGATVNLEMYD